MIAGRGGGGSIIITRSRAGPGRTRENLAHYAAAKQAWSGWMEGLGPRLRPTTTSGSKHRAPTTMVDTMMIDKPAGREGGSCQPWRNRPGAGCEGNDERRQTRSIPLGGAGDISNCRALPGLRREGRYVTGHPTAGGRRAPPMPYKIPHVGWSHADEMKLATRAGRADPPGGGPGAARPAPGAGWWWRGPRHGGPKRPLVFISRQNHGRFHGGMSL